MPREFDIIRQIAADSATPTGVKVGIGDDAAVLESGRFDLVTTDVIVEEVHYRRDWCSSREIGWRALAASLSDIAAMGGTPGPWVASVGIGPETDDAFATDLLEGMNEAADTLAGQFDTLGGIGGDLSSSPGPTFVSLTLLGATAEEGPLLRDGALPGDRIVVTGFPGRSAAGLTVLSDELDSSPDDAAVLTRLADAYRRPGARCALGAELGRCAIPSALIDVSDGLVADLGHIMEASEVGARLAFDRLPLHEDLAALGCSRREALKKWVLGGGEDFELLATVAPERMEQMEEAAEAVGWPVSEIGVILPADESLEILDGQGRRIDAPSRGWEHFS